MFDVECGKLDLMWKFFVYLINDVKKIKGTYVKMMKK